MNKRFTIFWMREIQKGLIQTSKNTNGTLNQTIVFSYQSSSPLDSFEVLLYPSAFAKGVAIRDPLILIICPYGICFPLGMDKMAAPLSSIEFPIGKIFPLWLVFFLY